MSLGFARSKPGVAAPRRNITADMLFPGPMPDKLKAVMAVAARQNDSNLTGAPQRAAPMQPRRGPGPLPSTGPTVVTPKPGTTPQPAALRQPAIRAQPRPGGATAGGIEAQIQNAADAASAAQKAIALLEHTCQERLDAMEAQVAALKAKLADVEQSKQALEDAAREAWESTFWMYGDVVAPALNVWHEPPPQKAIAFQVQQGATLLLTGPMVQTPEGPAMRARSVADNGQQGEVWVLLAGEDGQPFVSKFRFIP